MSVKSAILAILARFPDGISQKMLAIEINKEMVVPETTATQRLHQFKKEHVVVSVGVKPCLHCGSQYEHYRLNPSRAQH